MKTTLDLDILYKTGFGFGGRGHVFLSSILSINAKQMKITQEYEYSKINLFIASANVSDGACIFFECN